MGDEQTHQWKMAYPKQHNNQACLLTEQTDWFKILNVEVIRPESTKNILCAHMCVCKTGTYIQAQLWG